MSQNQCISILCTSFSKEDVGSNFVNEFVRLSLEWICWTSIAPFFKIMREEKFMKKYFLPLAELCMPYCLRIKLWEFFPYKIIHMTLEMLIHCPPYVNNLFETCIDVDLSNILHMHSQLIVTWILMNNYISIVPRGYMFNSIPISL